MRARVRHHAGKPGRRFWRVLHVRDDLSADSPMGPDNPLTYREYYGKAYPGLQLQASRVLSS